ncbi:MULTISPECIES: hypothetical protein [Actinosynnema]|uniref:Uncharacterized protein n=1 Tax=Actinosynnema pretiosum TaxID=42197 RepID=A0A290ZAV6_9PSEU|nr:hypothetical protein [Actinosynnema pretiosum]ATE56138.1 hypothetical protein CNX65_25045 [Actinosynnema pretiosum]MCP2098587.1 hypothetical protein [Actinosynnema pretiosum]
MLTPPSHDDLQRQIDQVRAELVELSRRTLRSARISGGGLSITDGAELSVLHHETGAWLLHVGNGIGPDAGKYFFTLRRDDGSPAVEIGTATGVAAGEQYWSLWDRAGNVVASDDVVSGSGLARPWVPMPTTTILSSSIPTTASTAFVSVQSTGWVLKQQPLAALQAVLLSTGGATGSARYTVNGVQVGPTLPITAGQFGWTSIQNVDLPGGYNSYVRLELQVQRINTAGAVGGVFVATQRQSL